tara:strand:- start:1176 stop:1448 length:273 start_codon:yes stop_codon:yes gene_type:complete
MINHSTSNYKWLFFLFAISISACKSTGNTTKAESPDENDFKSNAVNEAIINYCMKKATEKKSLTFLECYSEMLRQLIDKVYEDESIRSEK